MVCETIVFLRYSLFDETLSKHPNVCVLGCLYITKQQFCAIAFDEQMITEIINPTAFLTNG